MTTDRINYLRVPCRIVQVTRDAVFIDAGAAPYQRWIPLSLVHTLDERALTRGERMTVLRVVYMLCLTVWDKWMHR
jgi:hypothetical protein